MTTATTNSSSSSSPLPKLPNVVLNPLAQPSPYATSQLVCFFLNFICVSMSHIFVKFSYRMDLQISEGNTHNSLPAYKQQFNSLLAAAATNPSSPFRTASVQQKQWRPLVQQAAAASEVASNCYMEVTPLSPPKPKGLSDEDEGVVDDDRMDLNLGEAVEGEEGGEEEEEDWIEVSNKGNQTPSHWVFSDMIRYSIRISTGFLGRRTSYLAFQCREHRGAVEGPDPGGPGHPRAGPAAPRRHPAVGHVLPARQVLLQQRPQRVPTSGRRDSPLRRRPSGHI